MSCDCFPTLACSYALGMVLWCLSAGRTHAWADEAGRLPAMGVLVARVLSGKRPDLAVLAPDAPPALRALIERCWAGDPAARPTAAAVAVETAAWLRVRRGMRGKRLAQRRGFGCVG